MSLKAHGILFIFNGLELSLKREDPMSSERKFIVTLLRLKGIFVVNYEFKARERMLNLWVRPYKCGCHCPKCDRRCTIVHVTSSARMWRDLPICGWSVYFWYCPKEILCPTHGRVQEMIPWAEPYARITYRFEYAMLVYCQIMTQKAAARLLNIPTSTLSDLLHQSISRLREGHRIRALKTIGIDEISYCKGHKYATIVYDLDKSRVIWVGKGKGRETIDLFFNGKLSDYQKKQIKWASCDMSEAYMGAIKHHAPNARLVLDRFHIVKAINGAVDEVRKEQWRQANDQDRKVLKGMRWLLFKSSSKRSKDDCSALKALQKGNRRIYRAWFLKDQFESFWNFSDEEAAERFLKQWITSALRTRLASMKKLGLTLRKYSSEIISFVQSHLTNAVGEGLNRIIKIVKNRASGFRNLESFADIIFLTVGDLDLPAQIPAKFRAV
jgi:transposase